MTIFRLLLIWGIISGGKIIGEKFASLFDSVASVAVEMETSQMVEMIALDSLENSAPTPDTFAEYLRKNMVARLGNHRDLSKDFWGHPYRLEHDGVRILVRSAGPDGVYGTDDDIVAGFALGNQGLPNDGQPIVTPAEKFQQDMKGLQPSLAASLAYPQNSQKSRVARGRVAKRTQTVAYHRPTYHGKNVSLARYTKGRQQTAYRTVASTAPRVQTQTNVNPRLAYNIRVAILWIQYFGHKVGLTKT